jgi:hypothetical protein
MVAAMTSGIFVAFDRIVTFVSPLVSLLTSLPVMWREEHLSNL